MNYWGFHSGFFNGGFGWGPIALSFAPLFILLVLWSLFWKGTALWHAARRGHMWWFIIMLIINTAGILEIIYLFFVLRLRFSELLLMREHTHRE